jgi:hypothetical protein
MIYGSAPDRAEYGVRRACGAMDVESHLNETIDHILDLLFLRPGLHNHYHVSLPLILLLSFQALDPPALVNDALEQPLQTFVIEWTRVRFFYSTQNFSFPLRIIDPELLIMFDPADFNGAFRPLVEQLYELSVNLVNFASPVFNAHFD